MNDYILQVNHLKTYFKMDTGTLKAVDDVTFHLKEMRQSESLESLVVVKV